MKPSTKVSLNRKTMSLRDVQSLVKEKRSMDLFRFRTCCCDPRASK